MASKELRVLVLVLCLFLGQKIEVRAQLSAVGTEKILLNRTVTYIVWNATDTDRMRGILESSNKNSASISCLPTTRGLLVRLRCTITLGILPPGLQLLQYHHRR